MGADAARYLFAGASMVNDVRFGYSLGEEARRKLFGFWNIYTFFMTYAEIDNPVIEKKASDNLTDKWLNSCVSDFVNKAAKSYENYNTTEVVREFEQCVDDVSNWYVRINRRRFWKDVLDVDKQSAYNTLYHAIKEMAQVMAPILPFMTEHMWQNMTLLYEPSAEESIHLSLFPDARDFDASILGDVEKVRAVIAQVLKLRNERNLKVKQPLATLYLDKAYETLSAYESVIRDELNIKEIIYLNDFDILSYEYAVLNFQTAGQMLKGDLNRVKVLFDALTFNENEAIVNVVRRGQSVTIEGYEGELSTCFFVISTKDRADIARASDNISVAINTKITPALKSEGLYRELLRNCQLLRKEAGFAISDRVTLSFTTDSDTINSVLVKYSRDIERESLSRICEISTPQMQKTIDIDDGVVTIFISTR
jgi:isoleucyl-tRNA synthetase